MISEFLHLAGMITVNLLILIGVLFSAYGYGAAIIRIVRWESGSWLTRLLIEIALGLGAIAHLALIAGSLGWIYPALSWVLGGIGWILGIWQLLTLDFTKIRDISFRVSKFSFLLALVTILNLGYAFLTNALLPPISWDEVAYHMAIPKIYIQQHAISYISFIPYSNWPLESEMLSMLGQLVSFENLAHLETWSQGLLICVGLFEFGRKYFSSEMGLFAAAIFSFTPVFRSLAGTALVEVPLTLYSFLAVFLFIEWFYDKNRQAWVLSAIFGGLTASTKLNAAVLPAMLAFLMLGASLLEKPRHVRQIVLRFLGYGTIAFLVVFPWYLKSWIITGNPLWPFLSNLFGARGWDALGNEYLFGFIRKPNMPLQVANWFRAFWLLSTGENQFGPPAFRIGWLYLALFLPAALGILLLRGPRRKIIGWLWGLSLAFYTSWFLQTHQARFLLPALPIFALLGASGVYAIWGASQKFARYSVQLVAVGLIFVGFWPFNAQERATVRQAWPYLSGSVNRNAYLEKVVPGFPAFEYLNQNLPPDAKIWLALYEVRGYYVDRTYTWANPISQRILPLESFSDSTQLYRTLNNSGFHYVLYNRAKIDAYLYIRYGDQITILVQNMLAQDAHPIYQSGDLILYELNS